MPYTATIEEVADFGKFSFSFDEEDNFDKIDVKKGPDRFRMAYQEVCLKGRNAHSMWDLAESLEGKGYRLVDAADWKQSVILSSKTDICHLWSKNRTRLHGADEPL